MNIGARDLQSLAENLSRHAPMHCATCQEIHEDDQVCRTSPATPASKSNAAASQRAAPVDDMVGRTLGSFRLLSRLGSGGMGAVYLAEHVVIGSRVAVKILHPELSSDPGILQRFHAEARAVNVIGHDNILKIYDLCREEGLHYLIMEYLEGQALSKYITGPVPVERALPILTQVCDALAAAHDHGVVHRDLKPENIFLVERRGRAPFVKLLDFGVARLMESTAGITAVGMVVGTPSYMAPEQFRSSSVDGRADLYALGVLSYKLATGRLPFTARDVAQMARAHMATPPPPPATVQPGVHRKWSEITLRAMAKKPSDRYQDARAFKADLVAVMDAPLPRQVPVAASLKPVTPRPSRPPAHVDVLGPNGATAQTVSGVDLSKDGVFLAAPSFAPPLFSTLKLAVHGGGGVVRVECEVVRHVSSTQALSWGMSEGVGVQFTHLTESQKRALAALVKGEPLPPETPPVVRSGGDVSGLDPEVVLAPLRKRAARAPGDPYMMLDVPADADASSIRDRGRELRRVLQGAQTSLRASLPQRVEAEDLLERVMRAQQTLTEPIRRAEYDAWRGNSPGVAQAIASGLTVTELEGLRSRFLSERPSAASHATLETTLARAFEQQGDLEQAARAYERSLKHDPLNLTAHQRYASVRRQRIEQARAAVSAPTPVAPVTPTSLSA